MEDYMIYYKWRGTDFAKPLIQYTDWSKWFREFNGWKANELDRDMTYEELTKTLCMCFDAGQIMDVLRYELDRAVEYDRRMLTRANPDKPFRDDENRRVSVAEFKAIKLEQLKEEITRWWYNA